jgi:hypothetical protein
MSENRTTHFTPTIADLWRWWHECEQHYLTCTDEKCEWWHAFATFVDWARVPSPQKEKTE